MMKNIKIALIDSGLDLSSKYYKEGKLIDVYKSKSIESIQDTIGHATAISHIIFRELPNSTIYSLKIFDNDVDTTEDDLIDALQFIFESLEVDIIHISNGINAPEKLEKMESLCINLEKKGVIIVSALDNLGVVSYPAAFESVIGVYWDRYIRNIKEFIYVENSPVNILGYAGNQFVPWIENESQIVSGSSFVAPHITALLGRYLVENDNGQTIQNYLKRYALSVINKEDLSLEFNKFIQRSVRKINKVITFPLNKEIHAVLGNTDLVDFEIVDVYDYPKSRNIGKQVNELIYGKCIADTKVKNYLDIDWESDFDTIILGHTKKIGSILGVDYLNEIKLNAEKYKKNIYSFDFTVNTDDLGNFVISPYIQRDDVTINTFGSLYRINKPILAVVGTSSQQGKFNLQLTLRRQLKKLGYDVGQVGTEPSAALFGMEVTIPNGYESVLNLNAMETIFYLNKSINSLLDKEIIIVGTQSQTIPYSFGNLGFYPIEQMNILIASEPDATILCINFEDDIDYIENTIKYLESYIRTKVIALVIYPKKSNNLWSINVVYKEPLHFSGIENFRKQVESKFGIPAFVNGYDSEELVESCINFFHDRNEGVGID